MTREVAIDHDLETSPFYLKTDSLVGSDEVAKVFFHNSQGEGAGGIVFAFTSPPQYHVRNCDSEGRTDYPTSLPSETVKVWKITLTRGSEVRLVVLCNDKEVLNLKISSSTCKSTSWWKDWRRLVGEIKFPSHDTASDFYSLGKVLIEIWCPCLPKTY